MFVRNLLKTKKTTEKQFQFDLFKKQQNTEDDLSQLQLGQAKESYNFISADGSLKSGYGFMPLQMPVSEEDLGTEQAFPILGGEIGKLWKLKWYDQGADRNCCCLFYYNDQNQVCFDNLFDQRLDQPYFWPTEFSEMPFITNYRYSKEDMILLSAKDETFMLISGTGKAQTGSAPAIVSCCNHYGKLFAITAKARGTLVYTDADIIDWDDSLVNNLDFSDDRGDLNKIISFNDYLYLFRDFGITKVSAYAKDEEFAVSHIYKSSGYIYPETVVEMGDQVYFLEGEKLKSFDGLNVKDLSIECLSLLKGQDNRYANAQVFDGKYFLACRGKFDDENVGCEESSFGYKNNLLIVYDIAKKQVDILRGVDIRQMLALNNHLKSKLIACFYNDHKAQIGQLTRNGKVFGNKQPAKWKSGKLDFDAMGRRKLVKEILITSLGDCQITLRSEEGAKTYCVKGGENQQKISTKLFGNMFEVELSSACEDDDYITDFALVVSM